MDLKTLYTQMLRIRMVEEAIADRYSEQKMRCPTHLSIGQEAVAVGVSACLSADDKAYSSHRAHAHYLAKGGDIQKLIAELYGKETGCTGGRGGSMHLSDLSAGFVASTAIVANSIPLAVGNALHQYTQGKNEISIAYFGDGATEEGAFYEAANFAAVKQLPVLFVCENNQYSVYSPLKDRQPASRSIVELSRAIGLTAMEMDGNDVEKVYSLTSPLVEKVRSGGGPVLIECHTYRHREHCGPNWDDDLAYRPESDVKRWLERDPVKLLEEKLSERQINLLDIEPAIKQEIDAAFDFAEASSFPNIDTLDAHIYAD